MFSSWLVRADNFHFHSRISTFKFCLFNFLSTQWLSLSSFTLSSLVWQCFPDGWWEQITWGRGNHLLSRDTLCYKTTIGFLPKWRKKASQICKIALTQQFGTFLGQGSWSTFSGHFHFYGHCHGHHHHSLQMILDSVLFPASFSCHTWNRLTMWANFNFPENPAEAHRCHFCPPVCQSWHGQVNKYVPFIILGIMKL